MTAHPDKGGSEAKMAQVNEAYELLSNPEALHSPDMGVCLVVAVETIRLRSFSSRLGSAGSRLVEAT
ncbi:hypothetical protein M405DRAFT_831142, partial [Rhizopogon salebrosus TDB-379]